MATSLRLFKGLLPSRSCSRFFTRYASISAYCSTESNTRFLSRGKHSKWLENVDERIIVLEKVGYSLDEAKAYLSKTARLKTIRFQTFTAKIQYLKTELGLNESELKSVIACTALFNVSVSRLSQTVEVLVVDLKCDPSNLKNLVAQSPNVLLVRPDLLRSNIKNLPDKLEVTFEVFREHALRKTDVLKCSEKRIDSIMDYFKEKEVELKDIKDIMLHKTLRMIKPAGIEKSLEFLKTNLAMEQHELHNLVKTAPYDLCYFRPDQVEENYNILLSNFGDSKDVVKEALLLNPKIFVYKPSTLQLKFDYFRQHSFKLTIEDVVNGCLGYGVERMEARRKFLMLHGHKGKEFPNLHIMFYPGDEVFVKHVVKEATLEQFHEFKKQLLQEKEY